MVAVVVVVGTIENAVFILGTGAKPAGWVWQNLSTAHREQLIRRKRDMVKVSHSGSLMKNMKYLINFDSYEFGCTCTAQRA